ncbi:MAG: CCA tRNA nucleotidyltransferase [Gemmatimonadetes bacterium]|nr:CCA tRNA nucleotidyltransferase [Gemmatimonadota bacterium]
MKHLNPPTAVREIVSRLERAGYEAWCVGGAVRDALLGHPHLDWDLATSATPTQVMREFKRTVPIGVEFGTVGVLDEHNVMHEVTTFRHDVQTDGRHAVVQFGASLEEDLARRDFTMNAIAYHPKSEELRDPFEGQLDLKRGIVRAVGDPDARMREDRLRALRAIRFAARFGFNIEPATWAAIRASAPHLGRLSPERVKQELEKTMEQVEKPSIALEWWRETGALATLIPTLATAPEERFAALDFLPRPVEGHEAEQTAAVLARLAMLFFGEGERQALHTAKALKFSNADSAWIAHLAGAFADLGAAMDAAVVTGEPDGATLRRWVARIGRTRVGAYFALWTALWGARTATANSTAEDAEDAEEVQRVLRIGAEAERVAYRDPIEIADLAVDGEDLRRAGVPAGPMMGEALKMLLDQVLDDPALNEREALMNIAQQLAE